ncbi:MAG: hypothetical protein ACOX18_03320 [Bacillota bacterium]
MRSARFRWLLVTLIPVAFLLASCGRKVIQPFPDPGHPSLIPVAERQDLPQFSGPDLFSGEMVEITPEASDRIRLIQFFSPG